MTEIKNDNITPSLTFAARLRSTLAQLKKNAVSYFRDPGFLLRFRDTAMRALFSPLITYAAVSGVLPALMVWYRAPGTLDVDWLAAQGVKSWEDLFEVLQVVHKAGWQLATLVLALIILTDILLPRRHRSTFQRSSEVSVTKCHARTEEI
jgi:hypothetical protein